MPSTGATPSNAGSAIGADSSYTELGPPLKMMPEGFHSRTHSSVRVGGWISQYTRASRTRRAISCVYCAPKSRIRILSGFIQLSEFYDFHFARIQIDERSCARPVQPATCLTRIQDQRVSPALHLDRMRAAMEHEVVLVQRTLMHLTDVVNDEDLLARHFEAVRRLVQLGPHSLRSHRGQAFGTTIVSTKDAKHRDVGVIHGRQRKGRTVIPGVHQQACAAGDHTGDELRNRGNPV